MIEYICTLLLIMNKYIVLIAALMIAIGVEAQTNSSTNKKSSFSKPSKDYVMIQLGYENWTNVPDSIKIGGLGRAANVYLCNEFPIQKSNFSFSAGIGVATSHIFLKNQEIVLNDTVSAIQFKSESADYKKYKYATTYLEAPLELRYFENKENKNTGFKASIGLKVGAVIAAHTKSKQTISNKPVVEKVSTRRYVESYRYAATARIGYGNFFIYGQYAINNLFKIASGPENIKPFQLGICITGL
jgi:hypothetical protein